ncbi:hypothetical protein ACFL5X_02995 [Candidatus Omnitrophota bacterium]
MITGIKATPLPSLSFSGSITTGYKRRPSAAITIRLKAAKVK